MASIGVVGASWRAQYFLRIARELPQMFTVKRVLVRSEASAAKVSTDWAVAATTSMADFLAAGPYDFVVVAAPREVAADLILQLTKADIPVLAETPPPRMPKASSRCTRASAAPRCRSQSNTNFNPSMRRGLP